MHELDDLRRQAAMCWRAEDQAWIADPENVVKALITRGFQEYRREVARGAREHASSGGMWQGLDPRTGAVATVIWVTHGLPRESHVFIDIDGRVIEGNAWDEIDTAVLDALASGGGRLTLAQIAKSVRMSESAVQSVVSMLAERGKVRIAAVELTGAIEERPRRPLAFPSRPDGESVAS